MKPNAWSTSPAKRLFDFSIASAALVVSAPAAILVAAAVKFSSPGPVFFRQTRVGMHGQRFQIVKFRTMRVHEAGTGPNVTTANDERLTTMGRVLRKTKLDELPQLLNVLRGDMSFVGPRPKVPQHQTYVLPVRPGITGAASLAFRNEEFLLSGIPPHQLDTFQIEVLMPRKRDLDQAYSRSASLRGDLRLMFRTVIGKNTVTEEREDLAQFRGSLLALANRLEDSRALSTMALGAEEQELRVA